jgi:hypothetical protein
MLQMAPELTNPQAVARNVEIKILNERKPYKTGITII